MNGEGTAVTISTRNISTVHERSNICLLSIRRFRTLQNFFHCSNSWKKIGTSTSMSNPFSCTGNGYSIVTCYWWWRQIPRQSLTYDVIISGGLSVEPLEQKYTTFRLCITVTRNWTPRWNSSWNPRPGDSSKNRIMIESIESEDFIPDWHQDESSEELFWEWWQKRRNPESRKK